MSKFTSQTAREAGKKSKRGPSKRLEPNIEEKMKLLLGFLKYVPIKNWFRYLTYLDKLSLPGTKAIILDNILADIFLSFQKKYNTDFSNLMLNACAHTQHHFFFNSAAYMGKNKNP